jgi:cardiolipin synthase
VVKELEAIFLHDLSESVVLRPDEYARRPLVSRLAENASRLFSPVL